MTAALALIATGIALLIICHAWWRNPTDHLTAALSAGRHAVTQLFAKGPRA